jgi:hypothetical protein
MLETLLYSCLPDGEAYVTKQVYRGKKGTSTTYFAKFNLGNGKTKSFKGGPLKRDAVRVAHEKLKEL